MAWAQRLSQRITQPGVVRLLQAQALAARLTHWGTPSLAAEVTRRYAAVMAQQQALPPIVYAHLVLPVEHAPADTQSKTASPLPIVPLQPVVTTHNPLAMPTAVDAPTPPITLSSSEPTSGRAQPVRQTLPDPAASSIPDRPPLPMVRPQPQMAHLSQQPAPTTTRDAVPGGESATAHTNAPPPPLPTASVRPVHAQPAVSLAFNASAAAVIPQQVASQTPAPVVVRPTPPEMPQPGNRAPAAMPLMAPPAPVVVRPASPDIPWPGNRVRPLPVAQERVASPTSSVSLGMNQPLPLAQPPGSVIQRAASDTAVKRPSPTHRPTPAPSRVIQANNVVQRMPASSAGTTVVQRHQEEDDVSGSDQPAPQNMDMDELVDKVHRRFLRRLAVEGERRGKTSWP